MFKKYFIVKFTVAGISNQNISNFIEKKTNNDIKEIFVSVFSSNFIAKSITFHEMMNEKGARYPFFIMNTDRSNKKGMYWWSFLDLHPKKEVFLFGSFGFDGFKEFLLQDDKKFLIKFFIEFKNFLKKTVK